MLNITHNQSWVINHRDIYIKHPVYSSYGEVNASPSESQIYFICKRNQLKFSPFSLPIPLNSFGEINHTLVENTRVGTRIHRAKISLNEYFEQNNFEIGKIRCHTSYPYNVLKILHNQDTQRDCSIQSLFRFMSGLDPNIFDLEICYIGQSNRDSKNIYERLGKHEAILKLQAEIETIEPHKEILLLLLHVKPNPPATFMLGGFGKTHAGWDLNNNDLKNLNTEPIPFDDIINCAEAILINSFKPEMNSIFKNNLLKNNLKTVKYFREKGYGGISFELNMEGGNQRFFSPSVPARNFFMFDYDLRADKNNVHLMDSLFGRGSK